MRKLFSIGVAVTTALATFAPVILASPAHAAVSTTVVLTFDDGVSTQSLAQTSLAAHGLHGTFYVNSSTIGTGGYLTWAQLTALQTAGNEIAGHTLTHPDLATLPVETAQNEVCQDRAAIMSHGLTVTNFAYPYGSGYTTPAVRTIVQACGYNSARRAWGLYSSDPVCAGTGCGYPYAETIPPADAYAVASADNPQTATTLAQIETLVTQAETHGGGLVPIVFHQICAGCDPYSTTSTVLDQFFTWLTTAERTTAGTTVKTMAQVIGGAVQPADITPGVTTITCNALPCTTAYYGATTPIALAATDVGGWGVNAIRYTTDGTDPVVTSPAYTVPFTLAATKTVKYRSYDAAGNAEAVKTQVINVDGVAPTTSVTCNAAACTSGAYSPPVTVVLSGVDTGGAGLTSVRYTLDGSDPTPTSAIYTAPLQVSATTTVNFRGTDNAGNIEATKSQVVHIDTAAPASAIACNAGPCGAGWYHGPVQISLSATDSGGGTVSAIRYTTDNSDPTVASPTYSAPFTVAGATNIKFRAWDIVGNVEPTNSRLIQLDSIAPITSIACNGVSCGAGWYAGAIHVSFAAADTGGSGVGSTHFTTDGSDPTLASPAYSGPFTVSGNATIKYRSFDVAGNAEATGAKTLTIDAVAPLTTIKCKGTACSSSWYHKSVSVSLSATDVGSGVGSIHYTLDGSNPTRSSPTYTTPFTLSNSKNVRYRGFDKAGVLGVVKTTLVKIDTSGPTVDLKSPGIQALAANVKIGAHVNDTRSGVAKVNFYLDGRIVATRTKASFAYSWNTAHMSKGTHKLAAKAYDKAGNSTTKVITITVH